jgi:hypothetical protein
MGQVDLIPQLKELYLICGHRCAITRIERDVPLNSKGVVIVNITFVGRNVMFEDCNP